MTKPRRTWLLIRGLGREVGHWNDFPEVLKETFPQDEILAIDLPGAGEYRRVKPPLQIVDYVEFLRGELKIKKPKYNLNLVTISLGGMVGMEWMRLYPEEIQSGILINTSFKKTSAFYNRLRWQIYPLFFGKVAVSRGVEREKALLPILSNNKLDHERIAQEWAQISEERPVNPLYVLRQLAAASQYSIEEKVKVPTLLMVGLGDRLVSPQCSLDIHDAFGYPVERHPWGGHDLTVDDAEWVAQKIKSWHKTL